MGFGLLSLLLEICTLGMIALVHAFKADVKAYSLDTEKARGGEEVNEKNEELSRLASDILNGRIPPVLRTIKSAQYDLDLDVVRNLLKNLHASGVLEQDKRNCYRLVDACQVTNA